MQISDSKSKIRRFRIFGRKNLHFFVLRTESSHRARKGEDFANLRCYAKQTEDFGRRFVLCIASGHVLSKNCCIQKVNTDKGMVRT